MLYVSKKALDFSHRIKASRFGHLESFDLILGRWDAVLSIGWIGFMFGLFEVKKSRQYIRNLYKGILEKSKGKNLTHSKIENIKK